MVSTERTEYRGADSLIISIDIGTTFSGASFVILKSGRIPAICSVNQYVGQEDQSGNTKVPSVLVYDLEGNLVACGSTAVHLAAKEPDKYVKVEWFKLQLKPRSVNIASNAPELKLPLGRTVDDIFADFLRFMRTCVEDYMKETTFDGQNLWYKLAENARYILTHPNGWGGQQRDRMRNAAVQAGFVPDTIIGRGRVAFITEGEASLHWCIDQGLASALGVGDHIVVADVGGGTIDVSSFAVTELKPVKLQETQKPACAVAGSLFVTRAIETVIRGMLSGSPFDNEEDVSRIVDEFDKKAKRLFRKGDASVALKVGSRNDDYPDHGVKRGLLEVDRDIVARSFEPSYKALLEAVRGRIASKETTYVFMVGGFAASPYLFSEVRAQLEDSVKEIRRANGNTAKAVSDGAIAYYLERSVTARVAPETYGFSFTPQYNPVDKAHRDRAQKTFISSNGKKFIKDGFCTLVRKDQLVDGSAEHAEKVQCYSDTPNDIPITFDLFRYKGKLQDIKFLDMDDASTLEHVCQYKGTLPKSALLKKRNIRKTYYRADYKIVIALGAAEMTCHVEWMDPISNNTERASALSVWQDF